MDIEQIIVDALWQVYGFTFEQIKDDSRKHYISEAKTAYCFLCYNVFDGKKRYKSGVKLGKCLECTSEVIYYHLRRAEEREFNPSRRRNIQAAAEIINNKIEELCLTQYSLHI